MELSFCDLRAKEVVNLCDGQKLGNIIDLVIDCKTARVTGIVVPYERGFFSFFKPNSDIFIPWHRICKIGKDVILVDITPANDNITKPKRSNYSLSDNQSIDINPQSNYGGQKNNYPPNNNYEQSYPVGYDNQYPNNNYNQQFDPQQNSQYGNYNNIDTSTPTYSSPFFNNNMQSGYYSNLQTFNKDNQKNK